MTEPFTIKALFHFDPNDPVGVELALEAERIYAAAGYLNIRRLPIMALVGDRPIIFVPPSAPMRFDWPNGKGFWVWELPNSAGGSPGHLVDKLLATGAAHVLIKVHDGPVDYNGDVQPWIDQCTQVAIDVWFWGYSYGINPVGEARKAAERCLQYGIRGYVIDAEGEYKGKPAQATQWIQTFKMIAPAVKLGLASFRYPSLHQSFPFKEFLAGCDFHMPQVYWLLAQLPASPASQLERSVRELQAIKNVPVIPAGCAFPFKRTDGSWWRPTPIQMDGFNDAAHRLGLPGVNWWSYQSAEADNEFWQTIFAHKWAV